MNYFCIILQAKEEMKAAKTVYEGINNELKEELPVLYDRSGIVDFLFIAVRFVACDLHYFFFYITCEYFSAFSRIGCYVSVFSALANLRDILYKEMSTVCLALSRHTTFLVMK